MIQSIASVSRPERSIAETNAIRYTSLAMRLMNSIRISLLVGIFLALVGVLALRTGYIWVPSRAPKAYPTRLSSVLIDDGFRNDFLKVTKDVPPAFGDLRSILEHPFETAHRERARIRYARYSFSETPVTVADFLGDKIVEIRLTDVPRNLHQYNVMNWVQESLRSVIPKPNRFNEGGPSLEAPLLPIAIRAAFEAALKYQNGRVGLLRSDGRNGLVVQDPDGTWWCLWVSKSTRTETNPTTSAAVSPR